MLLLLAIAESSKFTLERPLHKGGEYRECDPYKEIAGNKPNSCNEWCALRFGASAQTGVREDHWHR
jgi:hypothetical protein